ncbi:MAG: proliferating cell nuclear antigen (pcna) [Candidatus Helarchaeota archaeon]
MFECSIKSVSILKNIIDVLTSIIDEAANFMAKPEGFGIVAMDPSHVSMIDFFLPKEVFEKYECDKKVRIGLNIGNLNKLLKRVGGSEQLTIKLAEKGNKLQLKFKGKSTRTFSLNLMELEEEEYPEPKMQFNAKITITDPSLLAEAIKDAELFSDHVKIEADSNIFTIFAKGDNGEVNVEIPGERDALDLEIKEKSSSLYPLSYLTSIIKVGNVTDSLTLEFSSEMPMQMVFKLKPIQDSSGYIKYFLAPRVEEEEEEYEEVPEEFEDVEDI